MQPADSHKAKLSLCLSTLRSASSKLRETKAFLQQTHTPTVPMDEGPDHNNGELSSQIGRPRSAQSQSPKSAQNESLSDSSPQSSEPHIAQPYIIRPNLSSAAAAAAAAVIGDAKSSIHHSGHVEDDLARLQAPNERAEPHITSLRQTQVHKFPPADLRSIGSLSSIDLSQSASSSSPQHSDLSGTILRSNTSRNKRRHARALEGLPQGDQTVHLQSRHAEGTVLIATDNLDKIRASSSTPTESQDLSQSYSSPGSRIDPRRLPKKRAVRRELHTQSRLERRTFAESLSSNSKSWSIHARSNNLENSPANPGELSTSSETTSLTPTAHGDPSSATAAPMSPAPAALYDAATSSTVPASSTITRGGSNVSIQAPSNVNTFEEWGFAYHGKSHSIGPSSSVRRRRTHPYMSDGSAGHHQAHLPRRTPGRHLYARSLSPRSFAADHSFQINSTGPQYHLETEQEAVGQSHLGYHAHTLQPTQGYPISSASLPATIPRTFTFPARDWIDSSYYQHQGTTYHTNAAYSTGKLPPGPIDSDEIALGSSAHAQYAQFQEASPGPFALMAAPGFSQISSQTEHNSGQHGPWIPPAAGSGYHTTDEDNESSAWTTYQHLNHTQGSPNLGMQYFPSQQQAPPYPGSISYSHVTPSEPRALQVISDTQQPAIIRTSRLPQTQASLTPKLINSSGLGQQSSIGRELPTVYPGQQAELLIEGDLTTMKDHWTEEEHLSKRRLIQFERYQVGRKITLRFRPIAPSRWTKEDRVVSCIRWDDRDEYYVTSVDCILLLELIIGQKFTVDEKNRVRRNLEICRPLTISKLDPETSKFFTRIMQYENPKPRNIEKDIKVIAWEALADAMQKIMSKYSIHFSH